MLDYKDGVDVSDYFKTVRKCEFLGFLPVLDVDCLSYYSVENIGTTLLDVQRVTPIFAEFSDVLTELEWWYVNDISKNAREVDKLEHEYYRDEVIEKIKTHQYCVWFVGCDDGDTFMRFIDKDHALQYLNSIDYFDQVYNDPASMIW